MRRTLVPLFALALVFAALLAPLARSGPPALPGGGAVVGMHVQLFRALDAGDAERAASFVGSDGEPTLLLDLGGEPERVTGRDGVERRLAEWARASKDQGYSTSIEVLRAECTSAALSYAVLEIERTRADGPEVERYVSTSLVQHRDGGWQLVHWHLSPAQAPAPKVVKQQR